MKGQHHKIADQKSEFLWDPSATAFIPLDKRIAEARLVDSQVPISKVMVRC